MDAETGGQNSTQETANACRDRKAETIPADIPAETAYLEFSWKPVVRSDWMVEIIWTKLVAPHAVIEPVSETRVRNGIFCCRDRAANWPHSARLQERRALIADAEAAEDDMSIFLGPPKPMNGSPK